jgi:Tc5 transposase C-terminal domain/DDE superfamily endonuclease
LSCSVHATTHSISIQPLFSADGTLHSPLLVCFYEPRGEPGIFEAELTPFKNLYCTSSTSGKFGSDHMEQWLRRVVLGGPKGGMMEEGSVLIVDEWGGWKKPMKLREIIDKEIDVRVIPSGATKYIQPLDVEFNRQFKVFLRKLCYEIRQHHGDYIIAVRRNLATLLSLIHRQFSAPRFKDYLRYSWFKSGYYSERPPPFQTPPQYCLQDYPANSRCAWCEKFLCFDHAIKVLHDESRCAPKASLYPAL